MHADQQMALAIHILQPSVDQIISRLEIQPGGTVSSSPEEI